MKLDYNDYVRLPNDGKIHEIVDGKHYNHPAPGIKHQIISYNIEIIFGPYVRKKKLGFWLSAPTDVVLSEYDIVQPDKIFISKKRKHIITESNIRGVPDMLIEITSATDPAYDRGTKMKIYNRYKVPYYLIVDAQDNTVEIYKHIGGRYKIFGKFGKGDEFKIDIFPELKISVDDIFEDT